MENLIIGMPAFFQKNVYNEDRFSLEKGIFHETKRKRIDLHVHSLVSDGSYTPAGLAKLARSAACPALR